ncbi:MAG TPA: ABC transporter permease, partial [Bryobacteraceae bacterium]|nr:ABC transporter permease [Bryobacteraceae bacterium]
LGLVVVKTFSERYSLLQTPPSTRLIYGQELRSDEFLFIGIAMMLTALLTLLAWQSLFPRLRDCLALAGLPVSAGEVFAAKFGAVSMVFFGYVFALNAPWAFLFATAASGPWQENPSGLANILATFAATAGACCFVFFSLLAVQGVLLNILPGRMFDAISRWIQAGLFIAVTGLAPLIGRQPHVKWWPGVWFLHLWEAIEKRDVAPGLAGIGAIAAAASIAVVAYVTSYHRYRRILLETPRDQATGTSASLVARAGAWLLEKWIPEPSGQAAFSFLWKTLTRSRGHRLALLAYAGLALGWIVKGALDMPAPSLRDEGIYGMLVTISPLAVALLITIAFRYLFSLPVSPGAKWIFQLEDRNGSAAWLAATERFVIWLGIAPVFAASLPAAIAILGAWRAFGVTALSFLTAVLWFEARFRKWRKLPFTCSFLPAKSSAAVTLVRYGVGSYLLVGTGALILYCSIEPAAFVALITFQIALWWKLMRSRRASWKDAPILYEDLPEAEVNPLELGEFTNVASPETAATPAREALFTASLLESRGLLPESWAEEIAEERRHAQTFLTSLLEDMRFGLRLIRRNAVVSTVVVLTLTAGIGINATIFTIVNGMVMRPHLAKDPASFVRITAETRATLTPRASSYSEYVAYRQARSVRNLAAWYKFRAGFGDSDSGSQGIAVSCNFFAAEGVDRPRLGRLLVEDDCHTPGQPAVAVISESTWRNRFASDPNIINRVIRLNNRPVPVIGVVADGTSGWTMGPSISVWIPYTSEPWFNPSWNLFQQEQYFSLSLAGRVAPGFTREAVRAELTNITYQQDQLHPGRETTIETTDGSWIEWLELTMSGRSLLLTAFFFGAFNLVLFISCANVATLQLSRAA